MLMEVNYFVIVKGKKIYDVSYADEVIFCVKNNKKVCIVKRKRINGKLYTINELSADKLLNISPGKNTGELNKYCCKCGEVIKDGKNKMKLWNGKMLPICYKCWIELMG